MTAPRLSVRPMGASDIPHIVRYWTQATAPDLERMCVDPAKLPPPERFEAQLRAVLDAPIATTRTFYLVWTVDGRAVGYSSLKNIVRGDRAEMHLHMWEAPARGRGHGAVLFCQSALDFYERFALRRIVCEPSRQNPMPNAMLRRVGFPLVGQRVGVSSDLSAVCELNTYHVTPDAATRFLQEARPAAGT